MGVYFLHRHRFDGHPRKEGPLVHEEIGQRDRPTEHECQEMDVAVEGYTAWVIAAGLSMAGSCVSMLYNEGSVAFIV